MTTLPPPLTTRSTAGAAPSPQPLNQAERNRAHAVASQLQGELVQLVKRLGEAGNRPRALARRIEADFSLCQRVLAATRSASSPTEVLRKLPGADGLRMVVKGMLSAVNMNDPQHPALAAVEKFEELIRDLGGSHARLIRRIESTNPTDPGRDRSGDEQLQAARQGMFAHAVEFTGKELDLVFDCTIIRPMADQPGMVESAAVSGAVGLRSRDRAPILAVRAVSTDTTDTSQIQVTSISPQEQNDLHMIPEFCSRPLPTISTDRVGNTYRTIIEPDEHGAIDLLTFGRRWGPTVDPRHSPERVWSQKTGVIRPTRRMVTDVYLHEAIAAGSIPQATAAIATAGISEDPAQNWDRWLPGRRRLEVLGPGLLGAHTDAWPRYADLMRWVFARLGWDAQQFVGYRMEETFPVWGTTYMMSFRYPEQEG